MREIRYLLMDPTANRTILVETPTPVDEQPSLAAALMAAEPTAEQVGFLTRDDLSVVSLRMAGGEFCANATMSAAAVLAMRTRLISGAVKVCVSGAEEPVEVDVTMQADGLWQGVVHLPPPRAIDDVSFADGQTRPVVSFDGIVHVIEPQPIERPKAEALARSRCAELSADALGLMFWDRAAGTLTPLVYVPKADTLYWENSCGSGTAAVGAYLAHETGKPMTLTLHQPGGTLEIAANPDGEIRLKGTVKCLYERIKMM